MKNKALLCCSIPTLSLLSIIVDAAYRYDVEYYRLFPQVPSPLTFLIYEQEPQDSGVEDIQTIDRLIKSKKGDCEDLACAFSAYETVHGRPCKPIIVQFQFTDGKKILHVTCLYDNGKEFDISQALGMKVDAGIKRIK